ncbi:DUF1641 domain-containing protein [Bremerella cremea]|uniref:DUF1641 domain-containing protein n=1 Tax=Bremerella cremea TaxID=1031537 RepID=UPI0031F1C17F
MSEVETSERSMSITDRLNDPQTKAMLHRLLDKAEQLDQMLEVAGEIPNLIAIATDVFDEMAQKAKEDGIDLQARAGQLLALFKKATEPQNIKALSTLVDHLPQLEKAAEMSEELPNLVAIATDVFDEWAADLKKQDINLEQSLRNGIQAALYLGGQIRREELDRLGYLLKSDVLSEFSVETVSLAGSALSSCRQGSCEHPVPKRLGLFGLLGASQDPSTQRALAFAVQFGKCFGSLLEERHPNSPSNPSNKA